MFDDPREEKRAFSLRFLSKLSQGSRYEALFDHLPDVCFFVKSTDGRFMRVNRAFLNLVHAASEDDVIGARDSDFFPANLAENYANDDYQVMRAREPMIDKAELVRNKAGGIDWFCTTKLPIFDRKSRAMGICGITRDVTKMRVTNDRVSFWAPVIETILVNYARPIKTSALAEKMGLSESQLTREFRKRFRTTPQAYLWSVRLNAASYLLATTNLKVGDIALRTGFHDLSHFTNRFSKSRGVPPTKYRAQYKAPKWPLVRLAPVRAPPTNC